MALIFNPHSTGHAQDRAEELRRELGRRVPALAVDLMPTEHAGHATGLSRIVAASGRPLVVSVSGDGGYNEVVNGVMQAGNDRAATAVLAAGNANDHRRSTADRPTAEGIAKGTTSRIDLLRLSAGGAAGDMVRYAHSYIGPGLTTVVAVDLEKGDKGSCAKCSPWCAPSPGSVRSRSSWTTVASAIRQPGVRQHRQHRQHGEGGEGGDRGGGDGHAR